MAPPTLNDVMAVRVVKESGSVPEGLQRSSCTQRTSPVLPEFVHETPFHSEPLHTAPLQLVRLQPSEAGSGEAGLLKAALNSSSAAVAPAGGCTSMLRVRAAAKLGTIRRKKESPTLVTKRV